MAEPQTYNCNEVGAKSDALYGQYRTRIDTGKRRYTALSAICIACNMIAITLLSMYRESLSSFWHTEKLGPCTILLTYAVPLSLLGAILIVFEDHSLCHAAMIADALCMASSATWFLLCFCYPAPVQLVKGWWSLSVVHVAAFIFFAVQQTLSIYCIREIVGLIRTMEWCNRELGIELVGMGAMRVKCVVYEHEHKD